MYLSFTYMYIFAQSIGPSGMLKNRILFNLAHRLGVSSTYIPIYMFVLIHPNATHSLMLSHGIIIE